MTLLTTIAQYTGLAFAGLFFVALYLAATFALGSLVGRFIRFGMEGR